MARQTRSDDGRAWFSVTRLDESTTGLCLEIDRRQLIAKNSLKVMDADEYPWNDSVSMFLGLVGQRLDE